MWPTVLNYAVANDRGRPQSTFQLFFLFENISVAYIFGLRYVIESSDDLTKDDISNDLA